jgi:hypothetical protein
MKPRPTLLLTLTLLLATLPAVAQKNDPDRTPDRGLWHASSKAAKSVTGDIVFTDYKITLDFFTYTIANIRSLTPAELAAAFDADPAPSAAAKPATIAGTLYRLDIPGGKKFLHGTPLCGAEDTQWIATYTSGKSLELLFFSGNDMPVLTLDALTDAPNLCGRYAYTR